MKRDIIGNGEISVEGRLVDASNATLFVKITIDGEEARAIYKPIAGERPLWDFPDGNLASRERAAYLVDQALGYNHIPLTILRDGPFGPGMVQQWIDVDDQINLETYFRSDDPQLREVALLDAIINNTDRKIGHLLPDRSGHLYVCDHGVTFHEEDKLRTVLWQWAGQEFDGDEISRLQSLLNEVDAELGAQLNQLITNEEIDALKSRIELLISSSCFPHPNPDWPHIPWPPF